MALRVVHCRTNTNAGEVVTAYTLKVRTLTKFGDEHTDTVTYQAQNLQAAVKKAQRFPFSAYGYNNVIQIKITNEGEKK